jgi:hypothetical protein
MDMNEAFGNGQAVHCILKRQQRLSLFNSDHMSWPVWHIKAWLASHTRMAFGELGLMEFEGYCLLSFG